MMEKPAPPAFAGHVESKMCPRLSRPIAVTERKRAHEAVQHRVIQLARHDARTTRGQPNLLLMMPSLRELSRRVEPIERFLFAGPAHTETGLRHRVELLMKVDVFPRDGFHYRNEYFRAEPSVHL